MSGSRRGIELNGANPSSPGADRVIEGILGQINRFWRRSGVPRVERQDRLSELRIHLCEAAEEGRDVAEVVGSDVAAFASGWIQADRALPWLDIVLRALATVAVVFGALAVAGPFASDLGGLGIAHGGLALVLVSPVPVLCFDLLRMYRARLSWEADMVLSIAIVVGTVLLALVLAAVVPQVDLELTLAAVLAAFVLGAACSGASWKMRHTRRTTRPS